MLQSETREPLDEIAKNLKKWWPTKPLLVVVDYVLLRSRKLRDVFQILCEKSDDLEHPVCFLLLERDPWQIQEVRGIEGAPSSWYKEITRNGSGFDKRLSESMYTDPVFNSGHQIIELSDLGSEFLYDISLQVSKHDGVTPRRSREWIIERLDQIDPDGRPLYAYFFGKMLAAGTEDQGESAASLLDWVLETDRRNRWRTVFAEDRLPPKTGSVSPNFPHYSGDNPSMHLSLLASIVGRLDCNSVLEHGKLSGWIPHNHEVIREARTLCGNIKTDESSSFVYAMEPDILGEWFVVSSIHKNAEFRKLIQIAWSEYHESTAEFVQRCSRDFPVHSGTITILNESPDRKHKMAYAYYVLCSPDIVSNYLEVRSPVPKGVLKALEAGANAGYVECMRSMASLLMSDRHFSKDVDRAHELLDKAIEARHPPSMMLKGLMYQSGNGVVQSASKAMNYYMMAVNNGFDLRESLDRIRELTESSEFREWDGHAKLKHDGNFFRPPLSLAPSSMIGDDVEIKIDDTDYLKELFLDVSDTQNQIIRDIVDRSDLTIEGYTIPFAPSSALLTVLFHDFESATILHGAAIIYERGIIILDGSTKSITNVCNCGNTISNERQAAAYLSFFCCFVRSEIGIPFSIVESRRELVALTGSNIHLTNDDGGIVSSLSVKRSDETQGEFLVRACLVYEDEVYESEFIVSPNGAVEMSSSVLIFKIPKAYKRKYIGPFVSEPLHPDEYEKGILSE